MTGGCPQLNGEGLLRRSRLVWPVGLVRKLAALCDEFLTDLRSVDRNLWHLFHIAKTVITIWPWLVPVVGGFPLAGLAERRYVDRGAPLPER